MNKRNTEGYVLIYVLIAVTVMGLIAATLMTSTLQVIQAQEKSVAYMKDKYEAQGEVERFMAELCALNTTYSSEQSRSTHDATQNSATKSEAINAATSGATAAFLSAITDASGNHTSPSEVEPGIYEVPLKSTAGSILVDAKVWIEVTTSTNTLESTDSTDPDRPLTTYTCTHEVKINDIYFKQYAISSVAPDPEGGGT